MSDDEYFPFYAAANPLQFMLNGKIYLTIKMDGSLEIGPDFTKEEAAKGFWEYAESFGPKQEITRLRADLAAANARIEAAYREGWCDNSGPYDTAEQLEEDWLGSDAFSRIDAALKGDASE